MFRISLWLIALFLFSCSRSSEEQNILHFWAMGAEGEAVQQLIPGFERENPSVKVRVQMVPWTSAQEKLITAFASENLPDVFQLGNTWIPQFEALYALQPLDDYINTSKNVAKSNYFSGIWETNQINEKQYGLPWYIDTRLLFYRSDILHNAGYEHPPQSWAQLYEVCRKIKKRTGNYAIYLPTNEWATFVIFGLQNGATLLKDHYTRGNFSQQEFKKAFDFLIRFHQEGLAPQGISQVTNVYQAFAEGYFAMYISGPWNLTEFQRRMKGKLADKWMTAPLPAPDSAGVGLSLAGGSSLVIARSSVKKDLAWSFIEYLSRPDVQIEFYRIVSDLPAVRQAWENPVIKNDPYLKAFFVQFAHTSALPKIPEWEQIAFSKLQRYAELAARGIISTEEALKQLDDDVDRILEKRRFLLNSRKKP